jgi:hypothetical protein
MVLIGRDESSAVLFRGACRHAKRACVNGGEEPVEVVMTPEDFTPEWFSDALGVVVEAAEIRHVVWGTGTKVLMKLVYAGDAGLADSVCVKGGFDERLTAYSPEAAYATETNFFARVAPLLDAPVPRCLYAQDGIIVLEDLSATGASFGDPLEPWDADQVAAALEAQAQWHRSTWGVTDGPLGELGVGSASVRAAAHLLLSAEHWETTFSNPDAPKIPAEIDDRERIAAAFERLWERDMVGAAALAHGDAHVGNTFIDASGRPGFLDWQAACRAPSFYDVAYFIGGAMDPEARRASERDLVRHYLSALAAGDGPVIDFDSGWEDYRRYTLHGFLWVLTPAVMQPADKVKAMGERHAAAIVDHDSLAALGV